jgi:hypothetical protein
MNTHATPRFSTRLRIWLAISVGLALLVAANWHLVHVAMSSQPECVAHLRLGEGDGARGAFSAARSACAPLPQVLQNNGLSDQRGARWR